MLATIKANPRSRLVLLLLGLWVSVSLGFVIYSRLQSGDSWDDLWGATLLVLGVPLCFAALSVVAFMAGWRGSLLLLALGAATALIAAQVGQTIAPQTTASQDWSPAAADAALLPHAQCLKKCESEPVGARHAACMNTCLYASPQPHTGQTTLAKRLGLGVSPPRDAHSHASVAIENAVAGAVNLMAWAIGYVILFYVVVALVYGRLLRKYRIGVLSLGLVLAAGLFLLAALTVDLEAKILWAAALLCCFLGIELSDFLVGKLKKRPETAT